MTDEIVWADDIVKVIAEQTVFTTWSREKISVTYNLAKPTKKKTNNLIFIPEPEQTVWHTFVKEICKNWVADHAEAYYHKIKNTLTKKWRKHGSFSLTKTMMDIKCDQWAFSYEDKDQIWTSWQDLEFGKHCKKYQLHSWNFPRSH